MVGTIREDGQSGAIPACSGAGRPQKIGDGMIKPGSRFRIIHKSHWAYGRKVWICSDLPGLRINGNPDQPSLVWSRGQLVEFQTLSFLGIVDSHVVPVEWCQEVVDEPAPIPA